MGRSNFWDRSSKYSQGLSLGLNMLAGMVVFTWLGYWLDNQRGGGRGWTLTGMFLGLFYCGYEVWKLVRRGEEDNKKK